MVNLNLKPGTQMGRDLAVTGRVKCPIWDLLSDVCLLSFNQIGSAPSSVCSGTPVHNQELAGSSGTAVTPGLE